MSVFNGIIEAVLDGCHRRGSSKVKTTVVDFDQVVTGHLMKSTPERVTRNFIEVYAQVETEAVKDAVQTFYVRGDFRGTGQQNGS